MAALFLQTLSFSPGTAETVRVSLSGDGDFTSIHEAIASTSNGDIVVLAEGIYPIREPLRFGGKRLTLKSEGTAAKTIIRMEDPLDAGQASVVVFQGGESQETVIQGLTLSEGRGTLVEGEAPGETWRVGGGIYCSGSASPLIKDCRIVSNAAGPADSREDSFGGGISCWGNAAPVLERCILTDNEARFGGGVNCRESATATLINCLLAENLAWKAGASDCEDSGAVMMRNCTIVSNRTSDPRVGVAGIRLGRSNSSLFNCIMWGHNRERAFGQGTISYSCIEAGFNGPGNFDDDPLFEPDSYRLQPTSPCIDTGSEMQAPIDDLARQPRPCGAGIDIGAYEYCPGISSIRITEVFLVERDFTLHFIAEPHINDWRIMGSRDLTSFPYDKTNDSNIVEVSPGRYQVMVDVSSEPKQYWFRIAR